MARIQGTVWRGEIPNRTPGGMRPPTMGLVMHIMQGTMAGTDSWFRNPRSRASAHFGNPKSGPMVQWVDTNDKAWAQSYGNPNWLSVEHEGFTGQTLTPSQIENDAKLLVELHKVHGIPIQPTDDPRVPGLGWHGMGGAAWGGHIGCPGKPIVEQRNQIVSRALSILQPDIPMPGGTVRYDPPVVLEPICSVLVPPEGGLLQLAPSGAVYAWAGAQYRGAPNGQPYFAGRVAHHIELANEGERAGGHTYTVISTTTERYSY